MSEDTYILIGYLIRIAKCLNWSDKHMLDHLMLELEKEEVKQ